jgi:uncharacterized protein with ATP-grasp and redox domains
MRTYLDCIPCFFRQALDAARMAGADQAAQKKILEELCKLIPSIPLDASPPEIGRDIYRLVREISGSKDPFKKIKQNSNKLALTLYPKLKEKINYSSDGLRTALELAIAGNVIDYGVKNSLDIEAEIKKIFAEDAEIIKKGNRSIFDYQKFKEALKGTDEILYLADNAGETVFDRIFIEKLKEIGVREILYAVKEYPVINDALYGDAVECGIDKIAKVISSGSDAPGTVLKFCSPGFIRVFRDAKLIVSKGQGNFEALSEEDGPIFFLFKIKCPVLVRDVGGNLGDVVLKSNLRRKSLDD